MTTSQTPRTDQEAVSIIGFYTCATTPANFSRQLERELQDAKGEIEILKDQRALLMSMIERAMGPCSWPEYQRFKTGVEV